MRTVENCVVIITGASRGIGAAIARLFDREGARLILCARNEDDLNKLADSLTQERDRIITVAADVGTKDGMHKLISTAHEKFFHIDIVINNAGVGFGGEIHEMSDDEYDTMININVRSIFYSFREALPKMIEKQSGQFINISSGAARIGAPGYAIYAATKAAVNVLSESVAGEVRQHGIKVNVLSPGSTDTSFGGREPGQSDKQRLSPDDVAEAVLFLAHQDANTWTSHADLRPLITKKQ